MIFVIQCAAKKKSEAGYLQRRDGRRILFVADSSIAPDNAPYVYAHPDDIADTGKSWREELLDYNDAPGKNPLGLLPAWQLYANRMYEMLLDRYGLEHLYILSAGWGLIAANFLTPVYDITFSSSADAYKPRRKKHSYDDLRMLPMDTEEPIVFFVSKEYISLSCELTKEIRGPRHFFYNSSRVPDAPGCKLKKYNSRTRTNWQYECAKAFIDEEIEL